MIGLIAMTAAGVLSFVDGNKLHAGCPVDPTGYCLGYAAGLADELTALQGAGAFKNIVCFPEGVVQGQVRDIILKWLADHPDMRARPGGSLGTAALAQAFPCPK